MSPPDFHATYQCRILFAVPIGGPDSAVIVAAYGTDPDAELIRQAADTPMAGDFLFDGECPPEAPGLWVLDGQYSFSPEHGEYGVLHNWELIANGDWRRPTAAELIAFHQGRNPWSPKVKPDGSCADRTPAWFSGHWREWHRGHGCDRDDSRQRRLQVEPPK